MDGRKTARRKFLYFFKQGFHGQKYVDWERGYKCEAHFAWEKNLNKPRFEELLLLKKYKEIAVMAVRIESRTNLLFSFEKMALRDAVKEKKGAELFAQGLYGFIYGMGSVQQRFEKWVDVVSKLPCKQTRVLTWPVATVFAFIARPKEHIFFKPTVTKLAAWVYGYDLQYVSKPNWQTYKDLLNFAATIRKDIKDLKPRDYIDLQSFIWVLGSSEYEW